MIPVKLTETVHFYIEPSENQVRLVVIKNGVEWVCRKESYRNLTRFLKTESGRIFKGRLQLILGSGEVEIEVKGTKVGVLPADYLRQQLSLLKPSGMNYENK
jgi:hypothetical protein